MSLYRIILNILTMNKKFISADSYQRSVRFRIPRPHRRPSPWHIPTPLPLSLVSPKGYSQCYIIE